MNIKKGIGDYRFLPMFLMLFVGILIGGKLILNLNFQTISIIIALTIIFFTLINFFGLNLKNIKQKNEKILSIIIGFFSGILRWIVYILCTTHNYLFSFIKFRKREFYKNDSDNVFFSFNTIVLSSLIYHGLGNFYDLLISFVITIPALLGQYFGTKIRMKLSNEIFRKSILSILIIIGFLLLIKNL